MKHLKQKDDEDRSGEVDVTQLSGKPEPTGVSKVGMVAEVTNESTQQVADLNQGISDMQDLIDLLEGGE